MRIGLLNRDTATSRAVSILVKRFLPQMEITVFGFDELLALWRTKPDMVVSILSYPFGKKTELTREVINLLGIPVVVLFPMEKEAIDPMVSLLESGAVDAIPYRMENGEDRTVRAVEELARRIESVAAHCGRVFPFPTRTGSVKLPEEGGGFQIIVIILSVGGVRSLVSLLSSVPGGFPLPVVVLSQLEKYIFSPLVRRISRGYPACVVQTEKALVPGEILIVPKGKTIIFTSDKRKVKLTPLEGRSISESLISVERAFSGKILLLVLSGELLDGDDVISRIRKGGSALVCEDPEYAVFPEAPKKLLSKGVCSIVAPEGRIALAIKKLMEKRKDERNPVCRG
ncbi:hypothetical protein J7K18_07230 [bacterium]|nr:hypothetical protein [bacterium]